MRTFYPNFDDEYGLETVLEVPIPAEMFPATKNKWPNIKSFMKFNTGCDSINLSFVDRNSQIPLLLGVIGAPLIPLPVNYDHKFGISVKDHLIESSMAEYIIAQYIAAVGGDYALNSVDSMYAIGKVKMMASEFSKKGLSVNKQKADNSKIKKIKGMKHGGEVGGFVLWSKIPDLWCLELVVSGVKICAGCDGKVAWRQIPWHNFQASRGTPRPLRRALQGLDPRLTANLFTNSICVGERTVNGEDCFALKMEADPTTFEASSGSNIEIIRHTVLGYFSQKTGLLLQLQDSHLLGIKSSMSSSIFQETTLESSIKDYRTIDGINIAHSGKTSVSMFRYGEFNETHSRTFLEEVWSIEEVGFNIKGLTMDCFLAPADLKREDQVGFPLSVIVPNNTKSTPKAWNAAKLATSKVAAIDYDYWKNLDGT